VVHSNLRTTSPCSPLPFLLLLSPVLPPSFLSASLSPPSSLPVTCATFQPLPASQLHPPPCSFLPAFPRSSVPLFLIFSAPSFYLLSPLPPPSSPHCSTHPPSLSSHLPLLLIFLLFIPTRTSPLALYYATPQVLAIWDRSLMPRL